MLLANLLAASKTHSNAAMHYDQVRFTNLCGRRFIRLQSTDGGQGSARTLGTLGNIAPCPIRSPPAPAQDFGKNCKAIISDMRTCPNN